MKALPERFWKKVEKTGSCWIWRGTRDLEGYGKFYLGWQQMAHRVSYEAANGPIPDGLTVDHLCRNTWCVNPEHLEAVTQRENIARGDAPKKRACRHGHPMTPENTYTDPQGRHKCRRCNVQHVLNHTAKWGRGKKSQQQTLLPCPFCFAPGFSTSALKAHLPQCAAYQSTEAA